MNPRCGFPQHLLSADTLQIIRAQLFQLYDAVLQHIPHPPVSCPCTKSPTDKSSLQYLRDTTNRILSHSLCLSTPRRIRRHKSHRPTYHRVHTQVTRPNIVTPRHEASRHFLHLPSRQDPTHNLARTHRPCRVIRPRHERTEHRAVLQTTNHTSRSLT